LKHQRKRIKAFINTVKTSRTNQNIKKHIKNIILFSSLFENVGCFGDGCLEMFSCGNFDSCDGLVELLPCGSCGDCGDIGSGLSCGFIRMFAFKTTSNTSKQASNTSKQASKTSN